MKLREGVVIAGKYTLVKALARGGMGSVWVARHRDLDVEVAVKFMAPELVESTEARVRFEREAKAAARLRSQHVMQVLDCGVEKGTPYIVMELLHGESLHSRLRRESPLSLPVASRIVTQICKALRTAHEAGLVHRDLKPPNIFLARKDDEEVAKVLDFGIAKTSGPTDARAETASDVLLGSVHHMSPEQIRHSGMVTHHSDLWSVGVILYEMVTGKLPFPGKDVGDVLVRICTEPFPLASSIVPSLPKAIDTFFERALARSPEERFQSASELSEAFDVLARAPAAAPGPAPEPPSDDAPASAQETVRRTPAPPSVAPSEPRPVAPPSEAAASLGIASLAPGLPPQKSLAARSAPPSDSPPSLSSGGSLPGLSTDARVDLRVRAAISERSLESLEQEPSLRPRHRRTVGLLAAGALLVLAAVGAAATLRNAAPPRAEAGPPPLRADSSSVDFVAASVGAPPSSAKALEPTVPVASPPAKLPESGKARPKGTVSTPRPASPAKATPAKASSPAKAAEPTNPLDRAD